MTFSSPQPDIAPNRRAAWIAIAAVVGLLVGPTRSYAKDPRPPGQ